MHVWRVPKTSLRSQKTRGSIWPPRICDMNIFISVTPFRFGSGWGFKDFRENAESRRVFVRHFSGKMRIFFLVGPDEQMLNFHCDSTFFGSSFWRRLLMADDFWAIFFLSWDDFFFSVWVGRKDMRFLMTPAGNCRCDFFPHQNVMCPVLGEVKLLWCLEYLLKSSLAIKKTGDLMKPLQLWMFIAHAKFITAKTNFETILTNCSCLAS